MLRLVRPSIISQIIKNHRRSFNLSSSSLQSSEEIKDIESTFKKRRSVTKELLIETSSSKSPFNPEKIKSKWELSLRNSSTSEDILNLIEATSETTDFNLARAASFLFDRLSKENIVSKKNVLSSVGMQKFLKLIRQETRHCDPFELISYLKLFVFLEAPGNDFTFQMVLKLISSQMNMYSLRDIVYLDFLMEKLPEPSRSPLSMAIHMALPMVFESQLDLQGDKCDPHYLTGYMHYASRKKLSERTVNALVDVIHKMGGTGHLNTNQATSLLWSLADLDYHHPNYDELITESFGIVLRGIDSLSMDKLITSLNKFSKKFFNDNLPVYYNEDFVNEFCRRMSLPRVSPDSLIYSVGRISKLRHINIEYLDRVAQVLCENPQLLLNSEYCLVNVIRLFSTANYKPEKWSYLEPLLLEHPAISKGLGYIEPGLALDMLALDLFPEAMIRRVFSVDYLMDLEDKARKNQDANLALLSTVVKVLHPSMEDLTPPPSLYQKWIERLKGEYSNYSLKLKGALEKGIGGENYVTSGVFKDGLFIDHIVFMRKGGYPIAVNHDQSEGRLINYHDLQIPPESTPIFLKMFGKDAYASNTNRLRGIKALEVKMIQKLGHPLIVVDFTRWTELQDYEKVPFIMQKIRENLEKTTGLQSPNDFNYS